LARTLVASRCKSSSNCLQNVIVDQNNNFSALAMLMEECRREFCDFHARDDPQWIYLFSLSLMEGKNELPENSILTHQVSEKNNKQFFVLRKCCEFVVC